MLPVKSMTVYSNESSIRELLNYQQTVSPVVKTRDNAWVFQWTVPSAAIIFPGVKYCFLFDMSSVNASTIKAEGFQKLSNVKPSHASSFVMPTEYYHHLRASDYFEIVASPSLFSEPWFARKFGGKDLERLVGGPLFSFSIVSSAYHGGDSAAQWDERRFLEHIDQRANYMADWFSKVIEESGKERFESGMHLGHLPNRLDTGYVQMEDRRRARARATGLLYHVNGRETLFTIGSALLDVSQEYYRGLLPFSKRPDPFRSHKSIVGKIMDYFDYKYSRYRSARRRLQKWIVELKKLCADSIPTVELMRDITAKFTGKHRKVRLPIIRRKVYLPSVIQAKIMENMRKMVDYEIRLIVSSMGDRLLRSATPTEHILSTVSRLNIYDAQKYTEYAAALRVYGSKFVAMANTFLPGLGYARLEDENVRCGLCFCFK